MTANENMKKLRESVGMSQEQLADRFGVTKVTISNLESGKSPLRIKHIEQLASIFNVSPISIIEDDHLALPRKIELMIGDPILLEHLDSKGDIEEYIVSLIRKEINSNNEDV